MDDLPRVAAVGLFAVAQVVAAFLPPLLRPGKSIGERSDQARTVITPPGWSFSLWGLLFAGCLAFAAWQAWPGHWDDGLSRAVGWLAAGMFAANTAWELYVPRRGLDRGSVAIILVGAACGIAAVAVLPPAGVPATLRGWTVVVPPLMLAGWLSLAAVLNILATSGRGRAASATPADVRWGVVALMGAGFVLVVVAAALGGGWAYVVPPIWGLVGLLTVSARTSGRRAVTVAAVAVILVLIGAAVLGETR